MSLACLNVLLTNDDGISSVKNMIVISFVLTVKVKFLVLSDTPGVQTVDMITTIKTWSDPSTFQHAGAVQFHVSGFRKEFKSQF